MKSSYQLVGKPEKIPTEAMEWLTAALDPYHDNQLRLEGLPDMVAAPSVVKMHNQSYTLTVPAGVVADWDATVAFTGCLSEIGQSPKLINTVNYDSHVGYDSGALPTTCVPFGSFFVKAATAGADMNVGNPIPANTTHLAFGACSTDPAFDRCRLIAVAFEVTNTTAEVYKQGSMTVAMLPTAVCDYNTVGYIDSNGAPKPTWFYQSWAGSKFAANRAALMSVPGAATWAAKDGLYAVPRMVTHTMPVDAPSGNKRAVVVQDSSSDTTFSISAPTSVTPGYPTFYGVSQSGFAPIQAFFTGLSHESSLTITFRTIVEYFPSFNSGLLPLTSPSPAFCPRVFEIYSRTARIAPYAVPVKQNGAGEYFKRILRIIQGASSVASPLFGAAGPYVAAAGTLAGYGADYIGRIQNQRAVAKGKAPPIPERGARIKKDEAGMRGMATRR